MKRNYTGTASQFGEVEDYRALQAFLANTTSLTSPDRAALQVLQQVFQHIPSVVFVCNLCWQQKGTCRCKSQGFELPRGWHYFPHKMRDWVYTVESLRAMGAREIRGLRRPATRDHLQAYLDYLDSK